MLSQGRMRLTPANFYSNGSLVKAMQDLETERWFHDPQFNLALKGQKTVTFGGHEIELEDGFFKIPYSCPEYLLWSACNDIDRRLPDDFSADAALIIKSPQKFAGRLKQHVMKSFPNTPTWFGNVTYYDPCSFVDMKRRPETIKHFSFLYQQEWRFCTFPPEDRMPNEPVEISIGSLDDIAELLTL